MKKAKIFKNGNSQAVRLPKEFQFKAKEVYVQKTANGVLLLAPENPWDSFTKSLDKFTEDFMSDREQPGYDKRKEL